MIKILKIDTYSGIGGGEAVMFYIVNSLKRKFHFVVAIPQGFYFDNYKRLNIRTYELKASFFSGVFSIYKIIKVEKPDILHAHGTRSAILGRIATLFVKEKPKIVYTLHGFHIIRRNWLVKYGLLSLEKFLNKWTDVLVCVSQADKELVLEHKTIQPEKIKVIRNGINIQKFQVAQDIIRKTKEGLGLENSFVLISIARLHPQKDITTILKALKLIIVQIRNVKLLIVGGGPLKEPLENETERLNLRNYVEFLGSRQDVPVLINISDVVILSTNWEGLPLIPLEAGACKKPVIASDVEGVREVVINNKTGYLFKKGDTGDLADKIMELYKDKGLRIRMGEEGYKFVLNNFSKERMIKEYEKLYLSLI
jgi:glycosyltransferase involved in cell wall biosynthesis